MTVRKSQDGIKTESPPYICNAIVESAHVRLDREFILTVWLMLKYDGAGQGFGGYVLGGTSGRAGEHDRQTNIAAEFIVRCMEVADVDEFSEIPGRTIRVKKADEWGDIIAIGHIVKDIWFCPKDVLRRMCEKHDAEIEGGAA